MSPVEVPVLVVVAQIDSLTAQFSGLSAQIIAGLAGMFVALGTIWVLWTLLKQMFRNPSFEGLLMIVGIAMFAVFLAGAAPGALDLAYAYGQSFWTAQ